jgi:PilZ domain
MIKRVEKRDFQRMPIDCDFKYSVVGDIREHQGKVINLSGTGILFSSSQKLEPDNLLTVVLTAPGTLPMHATVKVERVVSNAVLYEVACTIRSKFD